MIRRYLAALVLVSCMAVAPAAQAPPRWEPIGAYSGTVFSLARSPFDSRLLLAGTYFGGLYRSADGGLRWEYVESALSSLPVFAIAFDPVNDGVVYASTFEAGVFKSTDAGRTWSARNRGLTDRSIVALAVDPSGPGVVLAAGAGGVFRSVTAGDDWTLVSPAATQTLLHDPARAGVAYMGTRAYGLLRSSDGGRSWASEPLPARDVDALTYDARELGTIYAAADGRVYRRAGTDGRWEDFSGDLPVGSITHVAAEPGGNRVFALAGSSLFVVARDAAQPAWIKWATFERRPRTILFDPLSPLILVPLEHGGLPATVDNAATWFEATAGMQNLFVGALAITQHGGQTVRYAGTDLGVYVGSSAHDTPSTPIWFRNAAFRQGIFRLVPHPSEPNVVFAGTERVGVWKTTDFGQSWTQTSEGLVPLQIYDMAQSAAAPDTVYVAASSGLYRSADGGRTWDAAATKNFNPTYVFSVATDPGRRGRAFFGSVDGMVFRTIDDGETFVPASNGLPRDYVLELRISTSGAIYAVTGAGSLYASSDDGNNWFLAQEGITGAVRAVEIVQSDPRRAYVGTLGGGVYATDTSGARWQPAGALPFPYVFSLAVDQRNSDTVYAGTLGVFKSIDRGATWKPASAGLPPGPVTGVAIDAVDSNVVYASIEHKGIYRSLDSGASWEAAASGVPAEGTVPVHADVLTGGRVLAGTKLHGVHVSEDRGTTWTSSSKGLSVFVRALAMHRPNPSVMYAGALLGGMFKSTDGGATWRNVGLNDNQILDVAIHPQTADVVYAATTQGIMLSLTGGGTWLPLGPRNPLGYGIFTLGIAIDPMRPHIVYAASGSDGVFKSFNGGVDWVSIGHSFDSRSLLTMLIDPRRPDTLYLGTAGSGVFVSDNGGFSWSPLSDGLFNGIVTSLAADPLTDGVVYAGTEGGGVFRIRR